MLQISREQLAAFDQAGFDDFEDEMVAHSKEFSPRLCEVIGEAQLRVALRQAMNRATTYGFTNRGPMRLFIELIFLCGSAFDTDPQYPAIGEILNSSDDQMERAERIREGVLDYLEKVSGPNNVNVRQALEALSVFARRPMTISSNDFVAGMRQEMTRAFPQKAAYIKEKGLTTLIHEGRAEAQKYNLSAPRGEALIVVLMFSFGHGCTSDPLYPWIERTLNDERIIDPAARSQRLERKSTTWLEHVLARPGQGEQT